MRKIIIEKTVYSFEELSKEAQEAALRNYYNTIDSYLWVAENNESVEEIANALNCEWEAENGYLSSTVNIRFYMHKLGDYAPELQGVRAYAYIVNNFIEPSYEAKVSYKNGKKRYSKIIKDFDCPFTGYCLDMVLLEAFKGFEKDIKAGYKLTVADFIERVADKLSDEITADYEYQDSDEYLEEEIEANDIEFLENGDIA